MTDQFASLELARLYESQGYLDDALAMYRTLAGEDGSEDAVSEAREAVARLEELLSGPQDGPGDSLEPPEVPVDELAESPARILSKEEKRMADMLERWLLLMVVQKRVNLFKAIRARV